MKIKKISFVAISVTIIVTLFIYLFNTMGHSVNNGQSSAVTIPQSDTAFGGIFYTPAFPENIPYSVCKKIEKNYTERKEKIRIINEGDFLNGLSFGFIGVRNSPLILDSIELPAKLIVLDSSNLVRKKMEIIIDSIKNERDYKKINKYTKIFDSLKNIYDEVEFNKLNKENKQLNYRYYLSLSGYEFRESNTKFYIDKGTFNLAVVKWNNETNANQRIGEYVNKVIDVRYSSANKAILIPISKINYQVVKFLFMLFITLLTCVSLYFFLGLPFQVLLNISRGYVFCPDNIKYINQTTNVAFLFYLFSTILPYLFNLIFINRIPKEIFNNTFLTTLGSNIYGLLTIVTLFLIKKAFQKGNDLQNEQDLTV